MENMFMTYTDCQTHYLSTAQSSRDTIHLYKNFHEKCENAA